MLFNLVLNKLKEAYRRLFYSSIGGRTACVGFDVLRLKYKHLKGIEIINLQKARFDVLLNWIKGAPLPQANKVRKHMNRMDIFPLIEQQEGLEWLSSKRSFQYFIIDSYAELTDQKFTHRKEGWSFCCHYTDLNHTEEFTEQFQCEGLLAIEKIEETYNLFFSWFEEKYPGKQVVFIHYSAKYDEREKFKERAEEIRRVMAKCASERKYIVNLVLDESLYFPNEKDTFPYHYSQETYRSFIKEWDRASQAKECEGKSKL